MIDFHEIYEGLSNQTAGNQKKITVYSCLEVFFGYSFEGNLRLSFMSKSTPPKIESTKILHVVQGRENQDTYWTSFDLLNLELKEAYFSFCENLIDSISDVVDENKAMNLLKRRFVIWKTLFQKTPIEKIPKEKLLGLFGELTVLKDVIAPAYGINKAIQAWGGPDMQSKDFTIDNTWYEVKSIGTSSDCIHISSISQLSSKNDGHLLIVRVESVSPEFTGKCSALIDLIKEIILMVKDEDTENLLIKKIQGIGIDVFENKLTEKYEVKTITQYKVDESFPRITFDDIQHPEITGVKYDISVAAISRFIEE